MRNLPYLNLLIGVYGLAMLYHCLDYLSKTLASVRKQRTA